MFRIPVHVTVHPSAELLALMSELRVEMKLIHHRLSNLELWTKNMDQNIQTLLGLVAKLEADDTAAVAFLQQLRDQNKSIAAELDGVKKQLAEMGTTQSTEAANAISDITLRLTKVSNDIETAVAGNQNIPDLPPEGTPITDPDSQDPQTGSGADPSGGQNATT